MSTSRKITPKGGFTSRTRPTKISPLRYNHLRRLDRELATGFQTASATPYDPQPGPGQKPNELSEFPLSRDPVMERRFMEEHLASWVPSMAGVLGRHAESVVLITPLHAYAGSSPVTLGFTLVADYVLDHLERLPKKAQKYLVMMLARLDRHLQSKGQEHRVLFRNSSPMGLKVARYG